MGEIWLAMRAPPRACARGILNHLRVTRIYIDTRRDVRGRISLLLVFCPFYSLALKARMESNGMPGRIHVSEETAKLLMGKWYNLTNYE